MANNKLLDNLLKSESDSEKVINELTPEENKVALELLEEKIDGPEKDTPSEPEGPENTETDTPEGEEEKTATNADEFEDEDEVENKDDEFVLKEDYIAQQPEEVQSILNKYKGKGKEDIAQAVANAIAMKSPYLKNNEKLISQMKADFLEKNSDELIQILIDTQKETGRTTTQETGKTTQKEMTLPDIPEDDPELAKIIERETLKRLKEKYPNMPDVESMNDPEYKEWRRDLDLDEPDNEFRIDRVKAEEAIKKELSKVIYIQKELPNLYEESPTEILPLLTPENMPRLKALNDNPMNVLLEDLNSEIELIRERLKKYGITEKDIGVDFTITKDENGLPYNPVLNELISAGKTPDGKLIPDANIIGARGKVFWLKKGELAKKFRDQYDDKILTAFMINKAKSDNFLKSKLKDETLIEAQGTGKAGKSAYTIEDIEKETNPERIKQIIADLERM